MADLPGNPAARELGYCPCCGYQTLPPGRPGSYELCPVCDWVDDPAQFGDAEHVSDANNVALSDARDNFREHGACVEGAAPNTRDPDEPRDPNWPYESA
ncbi:CPCC family cysteine-rich protein [Halosimplex sp. TS25]|uniref:CPCC family cysteine-rich protein n=1 Tax=Halosimplex rarum TaxID=3396619 RepID=UPI0039EB32AE